ncbi:acyltransferase [Priestia abyssalis]|uniref:acyltransferase n=1 Tax=Priestia abyssalis TaxID=1221450 RepID=UPI000995BFD6|nr:acyltransferase [Priestia abyssalis]
MNSFYTQEELKSMGFKVLGKNVLISKKSSIYNPENIIIGNNVRIDDFCILSGKIELGNYIHIAAHSSLYGGTAGIVMKDFSGISSRVVIYSVTDDYSGEYLTNPTVPNQYRNVISGQVTLEKHVLVGANSVILPNVTLREGSAFGSCSLVSKDSKPWTVNVGIPATYRKDRSRRLLELENQFLKELELNND